MEISAPEQHLSQSNTAGTSALAFNNAIYSFSPGGISVEEYLRIVGVLEWLISSWKCIEGFLSRVREFTPLGFSFSIQRR